MIPIQAPALVGLGMEVRPVTIAYFVYVKDGVKTEGEAFFYWRPEDMPPHEAIGVLFRGFLKGWGIIERFLQPCMGCVGSGKIPTIEGGKVVPAKCATCDGLGRV